jgi:hypothetical protein
VKVYVFVVHIRKELNLIAITHRVVSIWVPRYKYSRIGERKYSNGYK